MTDNCMSAIYDPQGNLVTSSEDICSTWKDYYSSLFSACEVDLETQADLLSHLSDPLSVGESQSCEGLFVFLFLAFCSLSLLIFAKCYFG